MTYARTHTLCRGKAWTIPPKGIVELDFVHMEKSEDPMMPEKDFKLLTSMLNQVVTTIIESTILSLITCVYHNVRSRAHLACPSLQPTPLHGCAMINQL